MSRLLIRAGIASEADVTIRARRTASCPFWQPPFCTGAACVLHRCPRLRDVEASIQILRHLGLRGRVGGGTRLVVDASGICRLRRSRRA